MIWSWLLYLACLLGALVFYLFYFGWFAWFTLLLALCIPWFSLLVSLPAMLKARLELTLPESCLQERDDVVFIPLGNWHQALYMCILYDRWLEPLIWAFCEQLVKTYRSQPKFENNNWYTDI